MWLCTGMYHGCGRGQPMAGSRIGPYRFPHQPGVFGRGFSFQVRGQISLPISLRCLRVTPQATLTQAGTSKPRDTRRNSQLKRTPTPHVSPQKRFAYLWHTHTVQTVWHTHTETRGKAIILSRESSNHRNLTHGTIFRQRE